MDSTEELFRTAVSHMNRDEMMHYLSNTITTEELRGILLCLDDASKEEILDNEMEQTASEMIRLIHDPEASAMITREDVDETYLRNLEALVKSQLSFMRLIRSRPDKRAFLGILAGQFNDAYAEYRSSGGVPLKVD